MTQSNIIQVEKLVKKFGNFTALNHLNLQVEKGEVHGFLGPNGSGKSTTIRILLGLLRKNEGSVSLFNQDPWDNSVELHRQLSYVPGDVSLWPSLSGGEVIDLFTDLRGGINQKLKKQLLDDFQLDPKKKCRTYSKGNRQKVALVAALASDVDLYILDEPTSGLDPLMESVFQSYIKDLKKKHKTVLLSSHILAEVEALADRVTIIRDGQTVESGTLSELRHLSQQNVKATTKNPPAGLSKLPGISNIDIKDNSIKFTVDHAHLGTAIEKLSSYKIKTLTSEPPSLEELFMKHYGTTQ
jgi:ABC-2 type transport system ATP-binding protein